MSKYKISFDLGKFLSAVSPKITDLEVIGSLDMEAIIATSEDLTIKEIDAIKNKLQFIEITKIE